MTQTKFRLVKIITTFLLAVIMAQAVLSNNYILSIVAVVTAMAIVYVTQKRVKEIMIDERLLLISGKAARTTLSIFTVAAAFLSAVLMFARDFNTYFYFAGSVVAFSLCALLLLYTAIYKIYEKQD